MTPNEKLVWAAAFAQSTLNGDASPAARAHNAVQLYRVANAPDVGNEAWTASVQAMIEEMRRDA